LVRETGKERVERDGELHMSYFKYQTALQAVATSAKKFKDGEWKGKKLAELDVIDLVISKSMWYSHYKTLFPRVAKYYPDMLGWLKETDDAPANFDIWGWEKAIYTFSDLLEWIQEKEKETEKEKKKGRMGTGKKDKKDEATKEDEGKKSKKKRRN
jgi:hypothetical protein